MVHGLKNPTYAIILRKHHECDQLIQISVKMQLKKLKYRIWRRTKCIPGEESRERDLKSVIADHAIDGHEAGYQEHHEVTDGPGWLAHRIHGVDDCVAKPTECRHANQHHGQDHIGIRQSVQEGDNHEWQDVLDVVQMSPANSFHLRVLLSCLHALWSILRVFKGLQRFGRLKHREIFTFTAFSLLPCSAFASFR